MQLTDEKLISLCKNNNRDGFDCLFEKYEKYIYRLCYYYTNSKEDSLDLMQEVYIKIYKSIQRVDETKPFLPWLKTITAHTCINHMRTKKAKTISFDTSMDEGAGCLDQILPTAASVEEEVCYLDTRQRIENAIRDLPEDMKTAVILRHVEGMNYQQIGEIMVLPLGTVKTHLFRGRRLLRDMLKNQGIWEV